MIERVLRGAARVLALAAVGVAMTVACGGPAHAPLHASETPRPSSPLSAAPSNTPSNASSNASSNVTSASVEAAANSGTLAIVPIASGSSSSITFEDPPGPVRTWGCVDGATFPEYEGFGAGGRRPQLTGSIGAPVGAAAEPYAKALCSASEAMRACFDVDAEPLRGSSEVELTIAVDATGKATRVDRTHGLASLKVDACLEHRLKSLSFPAKATKLVYAFTVNGPVYQKPIPRVRQGATSVAGKLPPEVVLRIVRSLFTSFRACYEARLAVRPDATGSIDARVDVDGTGKVTAAKVTGGSARDAKLDACVEKVFAGLAFPETADGKPLVLSYTLQLVVE